MMEYGYTVIIRANPKAEGGGFVAVVPDLPGCISDGDTREMAARNVTDALAEWISEARRLGRVVPAPKVRNQTRK